MQLLKMSAQFYCSFAARNFAGREYNANLVRHVASGVGTPLMPNRTFETYVSSMLDYGDDDDLGPGSTSAARNFGLFRPDFTPVYNIGLVKPDQVRLLDFHLGPYNFSFLSSGPIGSF